eukprot:COSAG03_NODE_183_length_10952_cov_150.888694_10_plen_161_part_00
MKEENRAYATQINTLFVSQGSRAQCFNERPGPHSNGLKPSAPPHCVASSRNKAGDCGPDRRPGPAHAVLATPPCTFYDHHWCRSGCYGSVAVWGVDGSNSGRFSRPYARYQMGGTRRLMPPITIWQPSRGARTLGSGGSAESQLHGCTGTQEAQRVPAGG